MLTRIRPLGSLFLLACTVSQAVALTSNSPAQTYQLCRKKTSDPLEGCPNGTLYVSQSDVRAEFTTIQSAISSLPNDTSPHVILIAPGIYVEQLNVTRAGPLTLLGASDRPWQNRSYAGSGPGPENDVQVYWNSANYNATFADNVYTGVLTVGPTLAATLTGSGPTGYPVPADTPFGCTDFRAYNVDFRNEFAPYASGPAHAVGVSRANAGFYSCGFYSWQDTVYIGKLGNAYFHDVVVAGQTDFLYGFGTLFLQASTLLLRSCGGGITAWKGTNTTATNSTATPGFVNKYGVYVSSSRVLAANASVAPSIAGRCSLGRPWNDLHRSLYRDTYLDGSVLAAGYTTWGGKENGGIGPDTTMAVYRVYGPGHDAAAEAASNVTKVFDKEQASSYLTPLDVFQTPEGTQPNVAWIDQSVLAGEVLRGRW
ncbi:pectin methylesterase family protein [Biscogniauxia mediterranea]|nr:pectin methylesterase family protein [Biscogniauxia mediterranea]